MNQESQYTLIFFLQCWLNEAISNSSIFLENIDQPLSFENNFHKRRMFDEHYVLTATVMSVRYSKQVVNHTKKGLKEHITKFIEATIDAVDVRDMREHSDEYFIGKGKKKDEFYKGSSQNIQCDMSSSIKNENGYMLGNLIAMELILDECKSLLKHIDKYMAENQPQEPHES